MKRTLQQTAWAAAFATAAELSRRGYDVTFTMGNTQRVDLLCWVPDGEPFKVQVKGISYKNGFRVQEKFFTAPTQNDLYLVVVFVPYEEGQAPEFFILTHAEAKKEFEPHKIEWAPGGFTWGAIAGTKRTPKPYKDNWKAFPELAPTPY